MYQFVSNLNLKVINIYNNHIKIIYEAHTFLLEMPHINLSFLAQVKVTKKIMLSLYFNVISIFLQK